MISITELNNILGRELGFTPYNEPRYKWEWSEDLYWPAHATGRKVVTNREIPIIGVGTEIVEIPTPEYERKRICTNLKDQWVITRWFPPEELPDWDKNFPGAPYPARGYRIHSDYFMHAPFAPPTEQDTKIFIYLVRKQLGLTSKELLDQWDMAKERRDAADTGRLADEIGEEFTAFGGRPGKRGDHVSFPSTQKELLNGPVN